MLNNRNIKARFSIVLITLFIFSLLVPVIPAGKAAADESNKMQLMGDLNVGDRVMDNSWTWEHKTRVKYSGSGEDKPVTWIVAAKNHYSGGEAGGVAGAADHVTLIAEEVIGKYCFDDSSDRCSEYGSNRWAGDGEPDTDIGAAARTFLNDTFYDAMSNDFQSAVLKTALPNTVWDTGDTYTSHDKVFLPSTTELGDTDHRNTHKTGADWGIFAGDNILRAAVLGVESEYYWYWTRSAVNLPNHDVPYYAGYVSAAGHFGHFLVSGNEPGLRPALNVSSEMPVSLFHDSGGIYLINEVVEDDPLDETVNIPDEFLEAVIRDILDKQNGDITVGDMKTLNALNAVGRTDREIEDITGLEYAVNLQTLNLSNNRWISDLTPLAGLTALEMISLRGNNINDLSPLSGLKEVHSLNLSYNDIEDLTPLSELEGLERLILHGNYIEDLAPLSGLTDLEYLDLQGNWINDIMPLSRLHKMETLVMGSNKIENLYPLQGMVNLRNLSLYYNRIRDLSPLAGLENLGYLDLQGNWIANLSPLSDLDRLEVLGLRHNRLRNLRPLSVLNHLDVIDLADNQISDIAPLSEMPGIGDLNLSYNPIDDFTPLSDLNNLTRLNLEYTGINDLSPLPEITGLRYLNLNYNGIKDITELAGLTNLVYFELSGNGVIDLKPLSDMGDIEHFDLSDNAVSDIEPLSGMTKMRELNLRNNEIADITPLSDMKELEHLNLSDNAVSDIDPLSGLAEMKSLYLNYNEISDFTGLSGLVNLERIGLYHNKLEDPGPLSGLAMLRHVDLRLNLIDITSGSAGMEVIQTLKDREVTVLYKEQMGKPVEFPDKHLEAAILDELGKTWPQAVVTTDDLLSLDELRATGSAIQDLTGLEYATNMQTLYLSSNQISDLLPLSGLTALKELNLSSNNISDISQLSGLSGLEKLHLSYNSFSDLEPLAGLTRLRRLELKANDIGDIDFITRLTALRWLCLSDNDVRDPGPLSGLSDMRWLYLGGNRIADVSPLSELIDLRELDLSLNTLDIRSGSDNMRIINELKKGGTDVAYTPQKTRHVETDYDPDDGTHRARVECDHTETIVEITTDEEITDGTIYLSRYESSRLPHPGGYYPAGIYVDVEFSEELTGQEITITVSYDREKLPAGVGETSFELFLYNSDSEEWEREPAENYRVDKKESCIRADLSSSDAMHIGVFVPIKYGDADGDGEINVRDAIIVIRHIVGLEKLDGLLKAQANVTGEEGITVQDAILILRYIVGLKDAFPVM